MKCPNCNKEISDGFKFCPYCATPIVANKCPHCGSTNLPADSKFCPDCGNKIECEGTPSPENNEDWRFYFPYPGDIDEYGVPLYGYKDIRTGHIVIKPKYYMALLFHEGLAVVEKEVVSPSSSYGYIDEDGREIIPLQYDDARPFSEGKAWVSKYDQKRKIYKWSCIDKRGNLLFHLSEDVLISEEWRIQTVDPFVNGIARVWQKNMTLCMDIDSFINDEGEEVDVESDVYYGELNRRNEEQYPRIIEKDGYYGLAKANDEIILSPIYDEIYFCGNGFYWIKKWIHDDYKYGACYQDGKIIVPCHYSDSPYIDSERGEVNFYTEDGEDVFNYWGKIEQKYIL